MKAFPVLLAAIAVLAFTALPAAALPGLSIDAAVSVPLPTGDFADAAKTGIGGGVDVFAGLPMLPLKVGGRIAYNRFGHDIGDGNTSIIEVLPSVRYELGLPMGIFRMFGQVGAGLYNWRSTVKVGGFEVDDDGTEFGMSFGVGATAMNFMVMPMYEVMFDDNNTSFISLNVGMRF